MLGSARSIECIARLRSVWWLPLLSSIVAACSSVAPIAAPTIPPGATHSDAAPPTQSPAVSPIAISADVRAPVAEPTLHLARRVDALRGWALVGQQLRWTDDDGAHWRAINIPLVDRQSVANAFFLDSRTGWMIVAGPNDTTKLTAQFSILRTRDGGSTWAASPLADYTDCYNCLDRGTSDIAQGGERDSLMFLDQREGWAQIDRTETMNSYHADLFHTTDGGATWQKLPSMLVSGEFVFHTPAVGWQLGACCGGAPAQLLQTRDGGQAWQVLALPGAPDYRAIALPTFFDALSGVLPIAIIDTHSNDYEQIVFYSTRDGGQTWRVDTSFEPPATTSSALSLKPSAFQALDRDAWLIGAGRDVYQTANGGQSWRTLSDSSVSPVSFTRFMFADDNRGWGIALKHNCESSCAVLMRTSDGGRRWEPIDTSRE